MKSENSVPNFSFEKNIFCAVDYPATREDSVHHKVIFCLLSIGDKELWRQELSKLYFL